MDNLGFGLGVTAVGLAIVFGLLAVLWLLLTLALRVERGAAEAAAAAADPIPTGRDGQPGDRARRSRPGGARRPRSAARRGDHRRGRPPRRRAPPPGGPGDAELLARQPALREPLGRRRPDAPGPVLAPAGSLTMRRYRVAIDDRAYTIDVAETASDAFEVTVEGRTYEARLEGDHDLPGIAISPTIAAHEFPPEPRLAVAGTIPAAPATRASARSDPRPAPHPRPGMAAGGLVVAPMPGVVLEVHVSAGDPVRRGDPLLVLEAMKMRNVIRAPRDGVVGAVAVESGGHVASGDPLVRIGDAPG